MTGEVSIRRAGPGDAETLAALGAETFAETFGHLYKEEDLSAFLKKNHAPEVYRGILADPAFAVWLAEDAGGPAGGYVVAGPCALPVPDMPENAGEIVRLYLRESFQGAGLGARLLETALDWLAPRYGPVYLSVYEENPRAQKLYERFGFVKIRRYFYMVGNQADPEWIMERRR
ncbi:MAG: GNAT family N-acetyltransferase [Amphiplicatus sp.]